MKAHRDPLDKLIRESQDIERLRDLLIVRTECLEEARAQADVLREMLMEVIYDARA